VVVASWNGLRWSHPLQFLLLLPKTHSYELKNVREKRRCFNPARLECSRLWFRCRRRNPSRPQGLFRTRSLLFYSDNFRYCTKHRWSSGSTRCAGGFCCPAVEVSAFRYASWCRKFLTFQLVLQICFWLIAISFFRLKQGCCLLLG
jgi:hypothetical protein